MVRGRGRGGGLAGGIEIVALLGQGAVIGEIRPAAALPIWLATPLTMLEMVPSWPIMHILVVGGDGDGAAIALQRIAVAGHDLAVGVQGEMAVAGIAHARGVCTAKKPLPLMRQVVGRAGILDIALAEVADDAGILDEADRLRAALALGRRDLGDIFFEFCGFALEAGRRDVGEIVRDHVHRPIGRQLLRKTNEK